MEAKVCSRALTKENLLDQIVKGYFSLLDIESEGTYSCYLCNGSGSKASVLAVVHEGKDENYHFTEKYFIHKDCYKREIVL